MSDQAVPPPWPTGDAAFDAELPAMRARLRELHDPVLSQKATRLSEGIRPGRLEEELASCPPALEQLTEVGQVAPAERTATFAGLADAIARCHCNVKIPRVKALIYLGWRGPDGGVD